jgi:hypothetical protein
VRKTTGAASTGRLLFLLLALFPGSPAVGGAEALDVAETLLSCSGDAILTQWHGAAARPVLGRRLGSVGAACVGRRPATYVKGRGATASGAGEAGFRVCDGASRCKKANKLPSRRWIGAAATRRGAAVRPGLQQNVLALDIVWGKERHLRQDIGGVESDRVRRGRGRVSASVTGHRGNLS